MKSTEIHVSNLSVLMLSYVPWF